MKQTTVLHSMIRPCHVFMAASHPRLGPVCVFLECLLALWKNTQEGLHRTLSKFGIWIHTENGLSLSLSLSFFKFCSLVPVCSLFTKVRVSLTQRDSERSTAERWQGKQTWQHHSKPPGPPMPTQESGPIKFLILLKLVTPEGNRSLTRALRTKILS